MSPEMSVESTNTHESLFYIHGFIPAGKSTLTGQKYFNSNDFYSNIQTASSIILFVYALPWLFT